MIFCLKVHSLEALNLKLDTHQARKSHHIPFIRYQVPVRSDGQATVQDLPHELRCAGRVAIVSLPPSLIEPTVGDPHIRWWVPSSVVSLHLKHTCKVSTTNVLYQMVIELESSMDLTYECYVHYCERMLCIVQSR